MKATLALSQIKNDDLKTSEKVINEMRNNLMELKRQLLNEVGTAALELWTHYGCFYKALNTYTSTSPVYSAEKGQEQAAGAVTWDETERSRVAAASR